MPPRVFGAIDLGASGGRVMAGIVDRGTVALEEVHRFPNGVVEAGGHLGWDVDALFTHVGHGIVELRRARPDVESLGIDTWGVDYGLLDAHGDLLGAPIAHRDDRTAVVIDDVHAIVSPQELYAINGLQFLPFTTLYQLAAEQQGQRWAETAHLDNFEWMAGYAKTFGLIAVDRDTFERTVKPSARWLGDTARANRLT